MNYAVLFDFSVARMGFATYDKAIAQLDGKVLCAKFYGYYAKRNGDFNAYIKRVGADVAFTLGGRKKSRIDIRQIVDAIEIACTDKTIEGFFLVCGEVDAEYLIGKLQRLGKKVILGQFSSSTLGDACDGVILFDRAESLRQEERQEEVAVHEDREFLPYTDIETAQDMSEVKANLEQLISHKLQTKKSTLPKKSELEELLKKYF
ncbi:MAG: NYN domain-containing protein [Clostridia bacterium]|nr:NYN domain-containing protein [Clostridia bacterium]MDY4083351.1 NYN domain-containing protein [Eubacteriales bacterium]